MRVAELWRYPVKSMQGQSLERADLTDAGLDGDRMWAVVEESSGKVLTGRREPRLLLAFGRLGPDRQPEIELPDGRRLLGTGHDVDAALSEWLGQEVRLATAADEPVRKAEYYEDATDDSSPLIEWDLPAGSFVDTFPLLVMTTATMRAGAAAHPDGAWETRRFRPNVVVDVDEDGWVEDRWAGHRVALGAAVVTPKMRCPRCSMVTRPQPGLERDLDIFKTLNHEHHATAGMWTVVTQAGPVAVGDPVSV